MVKSKTTTRGNGEGAASLRSRFKPSPIASLRKRVSADDELIGAYASAEYLNLEDGKTLKIRIFPPHPDHTDFYIAKKCYWLTIAGNDGEPRRAQVLDSRVHGGTKLDLVDEYVKWAKRKWGKDADKMEALVGTGPKSESLNPQYSWLCYADKVVGEEPLKAKLWEFKKMVRDALNKLAFSEDEDEAIEVDPFTDPDEGLPVMVKYLKNPNKKKGENYYEVSFPKKSTARPLSDEELEYFAGLRPLEEVLPKYGLKDFERALDGLQNFDEENEMGLFDDDEWLERVEEVKSQYGDSEEPESEEEEEEEETKPVSKKTASKRKPAPEPEEEDDTEEEEEEEETDTEEEEGDEFDEMDRTALKKYIKSNGLRIMIKTSMSDDDLREAIRDVLAKSEETEEEEDEDEEEEDAPKTRISIEDIKRKLAGKK